MISQRIEETAPKIAAVLDEIDRRSPQADIYWVNYLPIVPDKGKGCWPQVPIAYDDVPYLRNKHKELNDMLAEQVAEYTSRTGDDAQVVDAYQAGIGKDACQLPGKRSQSSASAPRRASPSRTLRARRPTRSEELDPGGRAPQALTVLRTRLGRIPLPMLRSTLPHFRQVRL